MIKQVGTIREFYPWVEYEEFPIADLNQPVLFQPVPIIRSYNPLITDQYLLHTNPPTPPNWKCFTIGCLWSTIPWPRQRTSIGLLLKQVLDLGHRSHYCRWSAVLVRQTWIMLFRWKITKETSSLNKINTRLYLVLYCC